MVPYEAPVQDMRFVLEDVVDLASIHAMPGYEDATPDMVAAVLEEAAKLAANVLAPLNDVGDKQHSKWSETDHSVTTPEGFKSAYAEYRDNGWNAVPFEPEWGGQGLPWSVAFAVQEMWQASNMSFGLCPLLNQGCVELLQSHGAEDQQAMYLPKLISGEWTGTMNLTEPQAGSDLAAVRCRAERDESLGERAYKIDGQKIFITYGEHDLASNIVHMVLARTPTAPEGVKGISLFIVPKFLPTADGAPGEKNDLECVSIEHKMGINASPTCTMQFGENGNCVGWLVGEENQGLRYMFTMMNNARLSVGLQGVAIGDRAYQQALAYAKDRVQSKSVANPKGDAARIIEHGDVRRMLLSMKARVEASRALTYYAAAQLDVSKKHPDEATRLRAQSTVDLLTPVVKAWSTDGGVEVASLGVQVHGGMGYVEETGAAQHWRDARIAPIYEGTNGIQAADLAFRKTVRDGGAATAAFVAWSREIVSALEATGDASLLRIRARLADGLEHLETAAKWVVETGKSDAPAVAASSAVYLELFGTVAGGVLMAKSALAAANKKSGADAFCDAKIATAKFYADHVLPKAGGLAIAVTEGHDVIVGLDEEQF
jgi:alkylation response protein AidB-like acyl-CoA dehydrogenase